MKPMMRILRASLVCALGAAPASRAETIGVFYDTSLAQAAFAAGDVKAALQARNLTVAMSDLSRLTDGYANRKIVIALASDSSVNAVLAAQGGIAAAGLAEQAYALRTTTRPPGSYWALGGDANGAMYGGLQLAENIRFHGLSGVYNSQESPYLKRRGIKFNIPLDARCPTYYGAGVSSNTFKGTAFQRAVPAVWDMGFWAAWFDEMARHRYNALSLWNLHPFPALIDLPDYPAVALQDVQGFDGFAKSMSIGEKIAFWRKVMAYGRDRGFEIYIVDWNIYTDGAKGKYGIDNGQGNAATVAYMRKAVSRLLETYPDLTGFGVTAGENMGSLTPDGEEKWLWSAVGQGIYDFAKAHRDRKVTFIHRYHQTRGPDVIANFKPLVELHNVRLDMSYKYSRAHMYSAPAPSWITTVDGDIPADLRNANLKTWLEVRNEDFFMLHWGDPAFVRAYIAGLPDKDRYVQGLFIGSDGYTNARVFASKDAVYRGDLEVRRLWYTQMLWGRLAYDPGTLDGVFIDQLAWKYPGTAAATLFEAWSKASRGVPLFTEMIQGSWSLDYHWWPEACLSSSGFRTIDQMADAVPANGSTLCSIANSAAGKCGNAKTAYKVADDIQAASQDALNLIGTTGGGADAELTLNLNNIRALSYLGLYYSEKLRGAAYKASGQAAQALSAMGNADCDWKRYADLMDAMYTGMKMQRVNDLADWHSLDAAVTGEFTKLGGSANHPCQNPIALAGPGKAPGLELYALYSRGLSFYVPGSDGYSVSILSMRGSQEYALTARSNRKGVQRIDIAPRIRPGIYFVRLASGGKTLIRRMPVMKD